MTRYRAAKQRKAREEKPTVRSLPYHLGIKVVAYPSSAQKEIIRQNSDASRFFYNRLVALGNERWREIKNSLYCVKWHNTLGDR